MWLIPDRAPTTFGYHQLQFMNDERQGCLKLYVSPDGRDGSMPINTDALIHSGRFKVGERITHPLTPSRGMWLQVIHGAVEVVDNDLETGDGLGIVEASQIEAIFTKCSEVLLFDLGMNAPRIW